MANLSVATIRTNSYTEIYNHLQTGTYALTTNNIHPSFNNEQVLKEGYPQVVIKVKSDLKRLTISPTSPKWISTITCSILVWEDSSADSKSVADQIVDKITSGLSVLRSKGIMKLQFEDDDDEQDINYTHGKIQPPRSFLMGYIRFIKTKQENIDKILWSSIRHPPRNEFRQ